MPAVQQWTETAIIEAVRQFYVQHQRWPVRVDFIAHDGLPSLTVVTRRMGTWQEPVRLALLTLGGGL